MSARQLFYVPGTASLAPHMTIEESGASYELIRVRRDDDGNVVEPANYERLNPSGHVPALRDGDHVLLEAAAIVMHVSDSFPDAGLAPPHGSRARAEWYRWLSFLSGTVQVAYLCYFQPHRYATPEGQSHVTDKARSDLVELRATAASELGEGPYVLGASFSSADLYLAMMTRWGRRTENPWWDDPTLRAHYDSILARPAIKQVWEQEGLDDDVY
ncbi:MAG: glutathione S-transferase family protein [Gaiellaceae bacterium]